MELSLYLAQVMGVVFLAFAVGFLFNKAYYQHMYEEFLANKGHLLMMGQFALVLGLLVVLKHNLWEAGYAGLVTLLAWLLLLKGLALLLFPAAMVKMAKNMKVETWYWFGFALSLLLGLYLTYFGFLA